MCIRDRTKAERGGGIALGDIILAVNDQPVDSLGKLIDLLAVSYTHLRAHETVLDLVCRLLLEKKNVYFRFYSLPSLFPPYQ